MESDQGENESQPSAETEVVSSADSTPNKILQGAIVATILVLFGATMVMIASETMRSETPEPVHTESSEPAEPSVSFFGVGSIGAAYTAGEERTLFVFLDWSQGAESGRNFSVQTEIVNAEGQSCADITDTPVQIGVTSIQVSFVTAIDCRDALHTIEVFSENGDLFAALSVPEYSVVNSEEELSDAEAKLIGVSASEQEVVLEPTYETEGGEPE